MFKKTLAALLLVSLQVQAAPDVTQTLNDIDLEFFARALPASAAEILRKRKCKCFECLKATCAVIDTLAVNGNLTVDGVSVNTALTVQSTFARSYVIVTAATPVANADPILFPTLAANNILSNITHPTTDSFTLPAAGVYEVTWQAVVSEDAQFTLEVGGTLLPETAVGHNVTTPATDNIQIVGNTFITTTAANTPLRIINTSGSGVNLTQPVGGSNVAATITIKRIS